ncbi:MULTISPECIES: hypothetical protein [Isoptericola]|uniref:ATP/GTP-binding protein n=1 Tax=Isoptericola sediminis TaxID=2733572 RepID=A0A849K2H5_9MICO|nr:MULTISPECIES: hypothetical protein [Isoptericola]MDO8143012.1 hypothetical protein [Isoptericola sp. 178]MDO8146873.1 hypothetical protein [Isoptericola sp. b515]MDO8150812.1 hypothetical protein [Isoptericola sp. b408]NNU25995.1 hypothetical protein [Isoptericola sediminis]
MPSRRPSRKRPWGAEHQPLDMDRALGGIRHESADDGEWTVRRVTGGDKAYTCPACRQTIPPGTPHVVAWQRDAWGGEAAGLEDRRHWHASCWQRRRRLL